MKFKVVLRWESFPQNHMGFDAVRSIRKQAQPSRHPVNVGVYGKGGLSAGKQKNASGGFGSDTFYRQEFFHRFITGQLAQTEEI